MTAHAHAWMALFGSMLLSALAQVCLKLARGKSRWERSGVAAWAVGFGVATVLWVFALKTLDISYAYPLLALGYVIVTALAALVLNERVSRLHWFAVALISAGAACVAGS